MTKKLFLLMLVVTSCNFSQLNQDYFVTSFTKHQQEIFELNHMIDSLILPQLNTESNRYYVVDCKDDEGIRLQDVCHVEIAKRMRKLGVRQITIEKGICDAGRPFPLYIYKLERRYNDGYAYYYHYNLCDRSMKRSEGNNYIYEPLAKNWSLFVEKD